MTPHSVYFNFTKITKTDYDLTYNHKDEIKAIRTMEPNPLGLPNNTKYNTWGNLVMRVNSHVLLIEDLLPEIDKGLQRSLEVTYHSKSLVSVKLISNEDILVEFVDRIKSPTLFTREIGDKTYHIDHEVVTFMFESKFANEYISKAIAHRKYSLNHITLDIETYLDGDKMVAYCVCFYDGKSASKFYLSDFEGLGEMLEAVFGSLLTRTNKDKIVYIHNGSRFDLIFLLKTLSDTEGVKVNPVIKDGSFINIEVKYGPDYQYTLNIRDSFLLLPSSLDKLAKQFNVELFKGIFPYSFVNRGNLDYKGDIPSYDYFDTKKVSLDQYNAYCNREYYTYNNWDLRRETILYCELDCETLYKVIEGFAQQIFNEFKVNISKTPTLPSLAFRIFRTHYLPKNRSIPVLSGQIFDDISEAYYGGHVDMYIPKNEDGTLLYHYDVNSLYPSVMAKRKYPTKLIGYFDGDIYKMDDYSKLVCNTEAFLKVRVTAPYKDEPIIPYKNDNTTIYGEGEWVGWYYTEELRNALKYGYEFEVLSGYLFEADDIFSGYVNKMYEMKANSPKDSPNYMISKLLMNSLYGRFGMSQSNVAHELVNNSDISKVVDSKGLSNVVEVLELGDSSLISYYERFQRTPKINIAIASAVTANARVHMSQFSNNSEYKLYYSDTVPPGPSIFIDKPLADSLVSDKQLGLMKLEHVLTKYVGIGPKVYGGIDTEGNEFTKVKGFKGCVSLDQLERLLDSNGSIELNQEKWFRSVEQGTITIKNSSYDLKPTNNKRELIYEGGKLVGTKNIVINNPLLLSIII
uniref:DNA polymerase n=1 Tax=Phellinidium ferrugineofuscum TaxID=167367 RepID=UPI0023AA56F5|nr:DNA polymerase [Phellinidium ferrugineofuscum]WCF76825.1 DNA polymerase [Phellinidium ferrugineofuscum]